MSRRPDDAVLLGLSLLVLLLIGLVAAGTTGSAADVAGDLPGWAAWLCAAASALAWCWALVLVLVPLTHQGRRGVAGQGALAAMLALGLAGLTGVIEGAGWNLTWSSLWSAAPSVGSVDPRVAVVTAVVLAASPHVSHPLRQVGRFAIALGALGALGVGVGAVQPLGVLIGLLCGVGAGAAVHLLAGSPAGRPTPQRVAAALSDLGLTDVAVMPTAGSVTAGTVFDAVAADHPPLTVTVLGRDERAASTLSAAWIAATTRGERLSLTSTRQSRVEHAAMTSLLAERAGVRVLAVVAVGRSTDGDSILVTASPTGPALNDPRDQPVDDAVLADAWEQMSLLHSAGIAHRRIDTGRVLTDATGRAVLTDFGGATTSPDDRDLEVDRARLLVVTALASDADRAAAAGLRALGPSGVSELLPYLQPAVLDRRTRSLISASGWTLADLRGAASSAAGVDPPELVAIRRVGAGTAIKAALAVLVTYGLISALSGLDLSQVWDTLSSADWRWLAAGLVVSPVAQVFFAFSTMASTTTPLRYRPVLVLQYALQFIALALPATAARVAMDVRFFQSFGISAGASVSIGVIDSVSGFVVQILLIVLILVSGLPAFTQAARPDGSSTESTDTSDSDPSLIALTVAIGLVSLIVVLVIPKLRRQTAGRLRTARDALVEQARNARGALVVLRRPAKVMGMLGGNLGGQVVQAAVLGACLWAFDSDASFSQLILINTAVSLFAGLMPVPGGIGVAEAGYTAGLMAIGVPSSIALSTAIIFRVITFYLPPLWGAPSLRWLRSHSYA